jgi:hypothetical protein
MARGRGRGPQRPVKGFRPGKEPPELKKRRAKEQFGDLSAMQERLIELFAERSPGQARALIRRWMIGMVTAAAVLAGAAVLLATWSTVAAAVVGVIAVVPLVLGLRIRSQRADLEAMADAVSGRPPPGRR